MPQDHVPAELVPGHRHAQRVVRELTLMIRVPLSRARLVNRAPHQNRELDAEATLQGCAAAAQPDNTYRVTLVKIAIAPLVMLENSSTVVVEVALDRVPLVQKDTTLR